MFEGIPFLFALLLLLGGGPNNAGGDRDLLDLIPTQSYWQAKNITPTPEQLKRDAMPEEAPKNVDALVKDLGADDFKTRNDARARLEAAGPLILPQLQPATQSKDPEISAAATALVNKLLDGGKARDIRRLMAIRTLGERQDNSALPLLKTLADSKELFIADYARRAIAQIDNKPLPPVNHQKELLADLNFLPKDLGIVAQIGGGGGIAGPGVTLDKLVDQAVEAGNGGMLFGGGIINKPPDRNKLLARATGEMLKILERIGNVRVDGVTVGVSKDAGPIGGGGWGLVALRGKYDREAFLAVIQKLAAEEGSNPKISRDGKVDLVEMGSDGTILMPSNDLMIIVMGNSGPNFELITKSISNVFNGAPGIFAQDQEMAALIKTVDTTAPAWGVAQINKDMQKEKALEAFDTITLVARKAAGENQSIKFAFTGKGTDPEKIKASAEVLTQDIARAIAEFKMLSAQIKAFEPAAEVLESLKITPDKAAATLTGEIKPDIMKSIAGAFGAYWMVEDGGDAPELQHQPPEDPLPKPPALPPAPAR